MKTKELSFKEREKIIKYLFSKLTPNYFIEEKKLDLFNSCAVYLKSLPEYEKQIQLAFLNLDEDGKRIFNAEFYERSPKYWWSEFYSKSTYYRIKARSMKEFLVSFNKL